MNGSHGVWLVDIVDVYVRFLFSFGTLQPDKYLELVVF